MENAIGFSEETIRKILVDLNEAALMCDNVFIKDKIDSTIMTIEKTLQREKGLALIEDLIYEKMKEFKAKDPDLHFKLYMLYRKLQEGRISEADAKLTYKSYFGTLD